MDQHTDNEWVTAKEVAIQLGYSPRNGRYICEDMVRKGEWEWRYRENTNPATREYRQKQKKLKRK